MRGKPLHLLLGIVIALGTFITGSCNKDKQTTIDDTTHLKVLYNDFTYHAIKVGGQVWMVENLRTKKYRDKSDIVDGNTLANWQTANNNNKGAWCKYPRPKLGDDETYGLLYNGYAIESSAQLAPEGWHIPTQDDWDGLEAYLQHESSKMKESGNAHWYPSGGSNTSGFTALPGGHRDADGIFSGLTTEEIWWSSSHSNTNDDFKTCKISSFNNKLEYFAYYKNKAYSVRCIQDPQL